MRYQKIHTKTTDDKGDEEPSTCTEQLPAVENGDDNKDEAGDDSSCFRWGIFVE
jgi:hypothetical protein